MSPSSMTKKEYILFSFISLHLPEREYADSVLSPLWDTVVMTYSILTAQAEMWQEGSNVEEGPKETTRGRQETMCVYLLVLVRQHGDKTTVHAWTQMDSGKRVVGGGGGVVLSVILQPLPPVESISDCIMLGRQGLSECAPWRVRH